MAKTPGRDAVFSVVLRKQQYTCDRCDVRQHSTVIRNSDGSYFMLDEFQADYYRGEGRTPFKMHLRLHFRDGDKTNFEAKNLFALCPACTADLFREEKRNFRAENLAAAANLNLSTILNVKNFLMARCAVKISTRDTLALIDLLTQNNKDER